MQTRETLNAQELAKKIKIDNNLKQCTKEDFKGVESEFNANYFCFQTSTNN